jgi:DNA-binding MarR family transcriptional regulator
MNVSDFVKGQGLPFLAHVLKRVSDEFVRSFDDWYPDVGMEAPARTRTTLLALSQYGQLSVVELAELLRQSHPLVITWLRQLKKLGMIRTQSDSSDRRRTIISLTTRGEAEARKSEIGSRVAIIAYKRLMREADAQTVFDAIWRMEEACRRKPFLERLREAYEEMDNDAPAGKAGPTKRRQSVRRGEA